jgi:hypothetical protein
MAGRAGSALLPAYRSLPQWANLRAAADLHTGDPARNRRLPVGQAVEPGHRPSASTTAAGSSRRRRCQRGTRQLQAPDSTWAPTSRSRTRWNEMPSRPVPRRVPTHSTVALHELTGADRADTDATRTDFGRSHWTPNTRRRKRGSGHRTPGCRTPDARTPDRRTLDTHRPPDAGRVDAGHADADGGRVDRRARHSGHRTSWRHDVAGTSNRVAVGGTRALGNHDGSAVRPPANARDCLLHRQAAAGAIHRRPGGASPHCCPRTI